MKLSIEHQFLLMNRGVMLLISVISREELVKMENFLGPLLKIHVMKA